jgi:hypothetical protein
MKFFASRSKTFMSRTPLAISFIRDKIVRYRMANGIGPSMADRKIAVPKSLCGSLRGRKEFCGWIT